MTRGQGKGEVIDIKELLARDADFLRAAVRAAVEAALEAEMTEVLGAERWERTEARQGYRSGYYQRSTAVTPADPRAFELQTSIDLSIRRSAVQWRLSICVDHRWLAFLAGLRQVRDRRSWDRHEPEKRVRWRLDGPCDGVNVRRLVPLACREQRAFPPLLSVERDGAACSPIPCDASWPPS